MHPVQWVTLHNIKAYFFKGRCGSLIVHALAQCHTTFISWVAMYNENVLCDVNSDLSSLTCEKCLE